MPSLYFFLLSRANRELKTGYAWFGIILGVAMIINFMGLIYPDEIKQINQGSIGSSEAGPLLVLMMFVGAPIYLIDWPIWLLGAGRLLLKGKLSAEE